MQNWAFIDLIVKLTGKCKKVVVTAHWAEMFECYTKARSSRGEIGAKQCLERQPDVP